MTEISRKRMNNLIMENQKLRKIVQQLLEENKRLNEFAHIDALTGLNNRRAFNNYLNQICSVYIEEAKRKKRTGYLSVCHLDLVGFKRINDKFGYRKGDEVLKKVADLFSKVFRRSSDEVSRLENKNFRYGGDEFGLILPETNVEGLKMLFKKIKKEIENLEKLNLSVRMSALCLTGKEIFMLKLSSEKISEIVDYGVKNLKGDKKNLIILKFEDLK